MLIDELDTPALLLDLDAVERNLDGMAAANLAEPNSAVWLGFGYIYEQFGADDAAIAAYRKVTKPESTPIDPTDPWVLAQAHLKSLHTN